MKNNKLTLSFFALFVLLNQNALANNRIDFEKLSEAIYKAEGIHSRHPYGILKHYRHTTPRQACLNTIRHQYRLWLKSDHKIPYLTFLAHTYAPLKAKNDPRGLNAAWLNNVRYWKKRRMQNG